MKRTIADLCLTLALLTVMSVPGFAASEESRLPLWQENGPIQTIRPDGGRTEEKRIAEKGDLTEEATRRRESREIRKQLSQAGSTLIRIQMSGWAKVSDSPMLLSDLEELARETRSALGNPDQIGEITSGKTDQTRQAEFCVEQDGISYILLFHSGDETYLTANAVIPGFAEEQEVAARERMEELLRRFAKAPCVRTTYTAAIPGKLGADRMERISRRIFRELEGEITEEARDGGWISKTGYSAGIGGALHSGGKPINLNVALRYNDYEDRTYLWLGTPVISIPY